MLEGSQRFISANGANSAFSFKLKNYSQIKVLLICHFLKTANQEKTEEEEEETDSFDESDINIKVSDPVKIGKTYFVVFILLLR